MDSYTAKLWKTVEEKAGAFKPLLESAAKNISIGLKDNNAEAMGVGFRELGEVGQAITRLGITGQKAVADGKLDMIEGADITVALERIADEAEDVKRGFDEDKAIDDSWTMGELKKFLKSKDVEVPSGAKKADLLELALAQ